MTDKEQQLRDRVEELRGDTDAQTQLDYKALYKDDRRIFRELHEQLNTSECHVERLSRHLHERTAKLNKVESELRKLEDWSTVQAEQFGAENERHLKQYKRAEAAEQQVASLMEERNNALEQNRRWNVDCRAAERRVQELSGSIEQAQRRAVAVDKDCAELRANMERLRDRLLDDPPEDFRATYDEWTTLRGIVGVTGKEDTGEGECIFCGYVDAGPGHDCKEDGEDKR